MMVRVAIDGLGLVGAFGVGVEAFRRGLEAGRMDPVLGHFGPAGGELPFPTLPARAEGVEQFVSPGALRRVDGFSRLAVLAAGSALEHAGLTDVESLRVGLVVATGYGATSTSFAFMDSMVENGDACASPIRFSNSVHNAAAANVAILFGIEGPCLTVSQFEMSVPVALGAAIGWLEEESVEAVLFGGVDELCPQLAYAYARYFGDHPGAMVPLELERQTAIPGEGAAFFLLRRLDASTRPLAIIEDHWLGAASDRPDQMGASLILGADGHRRSGAEYEAFTDCARCHAAVYGALPVGPAFDLAAAVVTQQAREAGPRGSVTVVKADCHGCIALTTISPGAGLDGRAA